MGWPQPSASVTDQTPTWRGRGQNTPEHTSGGRADIWPASPLPPALQLVAISSAGVNPKARHLRGSTEGHWDPGDPWNAKSGLYHQRAQQAGSQDRTKFLTLSTCAPWGRSRLSCGRPVPCRRSEQQPWPPLTRCPVAPRPERWHPKRLQTLQMSSRGRITPVADHQFHRENVIQEVRETAAPRGGASPEVSFTNTLAAALGGHHSAGSPRGHQGSDFSRLHRRALRPPGNYGCCLRSHPTRWRPLCPLGRSSTPRRCRRCLGSCGRDFRSAKQSHHHSRCRAPTWTPRVSAQKLSNIEANGVFSGR